MHLAPRGDSNDMGDSDPIKTFTYIAKELSKRSLAFMCVRESLGENAIGSLLKSSFSGTYIANEKFTKITAEKIIQDKEADAVAFGKLFIANPDLPYRFKINAPLNEPDPTSFYGPDAKGYTDYSFYSN